MLAGQERQDQTAKLMAEARAQAAVLANLARKEAQEAYRAAQAKAARDRAKAARAARAAAARRVKAMPLRRGSKTKPSRRSTAS